MKLLKFGLLLALVVGTLTLTRRPSAQTGTCTLACQNTNNSCHLTDSLAESLCENNAEINEGFCEAEFSGFLDDCYAIVNYTAGGMAQCEEVYDNLILHYCLEPEQAADEECQNQQVIADAGCDAALEDCESHCPPGG